MCWMNKWMKNVCVLGKLICDLGFLFLETMRYEAFILMKLWDFLSPHPFQCLSRGWPGPPSLCLAFPHLPKLYPAGYLLTSDFALASFPHLLSSLNFIFSPLIFPPCTGDLGHKGLHVSPLLRYFWLLCLPWTAPANPLPFLLTHPPTFPEQPSHTFYPRTFKGLFSTEESPNSLPQHRRSFLLCPWSTSRTFKILLFSGLWAHPKHLPLDCSCPLNIVQFPSISACPS